MKIVAFLTLCTLTWTNANSENRQTKSISDRQGTSYSTNIVHQDPNNPDLTAQSSINVNFNTKQIPDKIEHGFLHHLIPKTIGMYQQQQQQQQQQPQQQQLPQQYAPSFKKIPANSQSFNVGYTMSFAGNPQKGAPLPLGGDIITGTRKGFVDKPRFSKQDFLHELFDFKKQKGNILKPLFQTQQQPSAQPAVRYQSFPSFPQKNAPLPTSQDNLSPLAQNYFSNLGQTIQPPQLQGYQQTDLPPITQPSLNQNWQNLGSGIELYKSTGNNKGFQNPGPFQPSQQFDHKGALGQSLGFDYTNAIDYNSGRQQPASGPVLFNTPANMRDNTFYGAFSQLQTAASNVDPQEQAGSGKLASGNAPKLPLDTRLLRNPVLVTDTSSLRPDSDVVPIHYDTHLIKDVVAKQGLNYDAHQQSLFGQEGYHPLSAQSFKVYGKPQPNEKLLANLKEQGGPDLLRQPRLSPKKRSEFNSGIETHLRPPPLAGEYQRKPFNSNF